MLPLLSEMWHVCEQAWGTGAGALGLGDTSDRNAPEILPNQLSVAQVSAGVRGHTMLIRMV